MPIHSPGPSWHKKCIVMILSALLVGIIIGKTGNNTNRVTNEGTVVTKNEKNVTKRIVKERLPDGTITTTTEIVDKSVINEKESHKNTVEIVTEKKWHVSIDATTKIDLKPSYGLQLERKLLGSVSVGGRVTTDGAVGVVIGVSF